MFFCSRQQNLLPFGSVTVDYSFNPTNSISPTKSNTQNIATVTSDINGTFTTTWTPPTTGIYKIIATFDGSNSHDNSSDLAYINSQKEAKPKQQPPKLQQSAP
jgi:hypothetical protein